MKMNAQSKSNVHVLHYVAIMNRAGQETFIMNLYRNMNLNKLQFGFLCSDPRKGDYDEEIGEMGGSLYHIELDESHSKLRHINNYFRLKRKLKSLAKDYDVFHIHTHHAFDGYLNARAAIKAGFTQVIVHSHSDYAEGHIKLHHISKHFLKHLKVTRLACSKAAGEWLFEPGQFEVIANGIDTAKFAFDADMRQKMREGLGISDEFVVGHVGRFVPLKNHELLVKAFAEFHEKNPNSKLLLVGEGQLMEAMKELARNLGLEKQIIFTGSKADTYNYYQAMDLFVLPSQFEGLSIVTVEAQTSGLPCLVSKVLPPEVEVTDLVRRCDPSAEASVWGAQIQECYRNKPVRVDQSNMVEERGFGIKGVAERLGMIYGK